MDNATKQITEYQESLGLQRLKMTLMKDNRLTPEQRQTLIKIACEKPIIFVNATVTKVFPEYDVVYVNPMQCYDIFEHIVFPMAKLFEDETIFTVPWKGKNGIKLKAKEVDCSTLSKGDVFQGRVKLNVYAGYENKHGVYFTILPFEE